MTLRLIKLELPNQIYSMIQGRSRHSSDFQPQPRTQFGLRIRDSVENVPRSVKVQKEGSEKNDKSVYARPGPVKWPCPVLPKP